MTMPRNIGKTLFVALALLLPAPALAVQANPAKPGLEPPVFLPEPFPIESLGVTLRMPEESNVDLTRVGGGRARAVISGPGGQYLIQIFSSVTADNSLTIDAVIDGIIQNEPQLDGVVDPRTGELRKPEVVGRLRADEETLVAGQPAGRVYLRYPNTNALVTGYTVFQPRENEFLIFKLDCADPFFDQSRLTYETFVAAAEFTDPGLVDAERAAALMAGGRLLSSFSTADLDAALSEEPLFLRIYEPAPTGSPGDATEHGFQRIEIRKGQLGELNPDVPRARWTPAEREFGYLVVVESRLVLRPDKDPLPGMRPAEALVDTRAVYFLSNDRERESWSTSTTVRQGEAREHTVETLVRRGPRLTVKTEASGRPPQVSDFSLQNLTESGYISRVEFYMLPRLIAAKHPRGSAALYDLGFYNWDSRVGELTFRRDRFETNGDGRWTYTSIPTVAAQPVTTTLDAEGRVVLRELGGGRLVEPADPGRIRKLWREKGMPLD